ncbi:MAG: ATP-binding cassette domain-containing protein [Bacteroidales bacterium]|nr:ATP-binding cassette domain-containing protein [Bacteroidales bacterium]MCB9013890.1 ATP-binding cassette domain-containing protein [Bacteroidales bacterium]
MNQSFIDAIMQFLSLVFLPFPGGNFTGQKQKLHEYVEKAGIEIDPEECLKICQNYTEKYSQQLKIDLDGQKEIPGLLYRQILADAGRKAQQNLFLKERFLIILALLEFSEMFFPSNPEYKEEIARLARNLNLDDEDYEEAISFISKTYDKKSPDLLILEADQNQEDTLEGKWIEGHENETGEEESRDIFQRIHGRIIFRFFTKFNLLAFKYEGNRKLFLNQKIVFPAFFYSLNYQDQLCFEGLAPIQSSEIARHFKISGNSQKISLKAVDLEFSYGKKQSSVKPFSIYEESGNFIGIIGNNGVGKSTILKLIAGHLLPTRGKIYINDTDLIKDNFRIQSVIGFVSQEDMIFPELSIYENLLFQARLSLGNLSSKLIKERVENIIRKFDLQEIRNFRVQELNNRNLTEYMRKCINLGIEMLRNPMILCLDEALTGLPYSDAKRLMSLLKEEVFAGTLVIMTVNLPTLEIFRFFDSIWLIDHDGYMIYSGEPKSTYSYLNETGLIPFHLREKHPDEISPEEIINLIETRKIDPDGKIGEERLIKPEIWYQAYRKKLNAENIPVTKKQKAAPVSVSGIPGIERQILIYFHRNLLQFFSGWRNSLIFLVGMPLIGILLSVVLRNVSAPYFLPGENQFLPLYLFFLVNYMMFAGMLTAAEAIYRERKNLFRDYQDNLSHFSYITSKVLFILILSLIQILLINLSSNAILEIKGLELKYIAVLFAVSSFAVLLSLNLSSAVRNLSSLYLLIPFILIPCMTLTGYLIPFDNYNKFRPADKKIPLVADLIPTRWAYEALVVSHFKDNPFNRNYFRIEFAEYQNKFNREKLLPLLEKVLEESRSLIGEADSVPVLNRKLRLLSNEFRLLAERDEIAPFEYITALNSRDFDDDIYENAFGYLTYINFQIESSDIEIENMRNRVTQRIIDSLQNEKIENFKNQNHSEVIEKLVYGKYPEGQVKIYGDHVIKSGSPVFLWPESKTGRSAFFSAYKRFGDEIYDTLQFNTGVIWILTFLLYLFLVTDSSREVFNIFRRNKLKKD